MTEGRQLAIHAALIAEIYSLLNVSHLSRFIVQLFYWECIYAYIPKEWLKNIALSHYSYIQFDVLTL